MKADEFPDKSFAEKCWTHDIEKLLALAGLKLKHTAIDVTAASWIKTTEDGKWYLYIASPIVQSSLQSAYRRIYGVVRSMPQPFSIDPFEVRLIDPSEPVAQEVAKVQSQFPVQAIPTWFNGSNIAGMDIEGAYIYPLSVTSPK